MAVFPIQAGKRFLGWLLAETLHHQHRFSAIETTLLKTVAKHLGITLDRLLTAESLMKTGHQYATIVNNIPGAVYHAVFTNQTFIYQYFSQEIREITGYTAEAFLTSQNDFLRQCIHPEDQNRVQTIIQNQLQQQQPYQLQYRILTNTDEIKYLSERGQGTFDQAGNLLYIDGVLNDVTTRETLQRAMQRRAAQFEAIVEVGQNTSAILNIEQLISKTVEEISQRFGFYYAGLFLLDDDEAWAILRAGSGEAGRRMVEENHRLKNDVTSMVGFAISQGQARIAHRVGDEVQRFEHPYLPLTQSEIALPLITRGKVIGALDVQSELPNAFSKEDIATLQLMANQLANVVENAKLFRRLQIRETSLSAIHEITLLASSSLDSRRVLAEASHRLVEIFEIDHCAFFVFNEDSTGTILAEYPIIGTLNRTFAKDKAPFQRQLLETRNSVVIENASVDERLGAFQEQFLGWGFQSMAIIPLLAGGNLIGSFSLEATTYDRKFSTQEISLAESMANTIAVSIDNARLFERTERNLQQANLLYKTTQALMQASDENELFNTFVQQTAELGADSVSVSLFQEINNQTYVVVKGFWSRYSTPTQQGDRYLLDDFALKSLVLHDETVVVQQIHLDDKLSDEARQYLITRDVNSLVVLPLSRENLRGTVHIAYKKHQNNFSKNQVRFFEGLVQQLSILWQNVQLLTSVQNQVKREQAIRELTSKIYAASSVDQILQTTITELTRNFEVTSGKIQLKVEQNQNQL